MRHFILLFGCVLGTENISELLGNFKQYVYSIKLALSLATIFWLFFKRASELFVTVRYCIITLTIFVIICMILLSMALAWYLLKTTLIFDGRSGLPIESPFSGTSMFGHSRYQKTRSPTPTRDNLRKWFSCWFIKYLNSRLHWEFLHLEILI